KFNLEANAMINLSFKLSSFDFVVDITDDSEVKEKQEKDKIGSKRTETGSVEKPDSVEGQSQSRKKKKRRKYKVQGTKDANSQSCMQERLKTRARNAIKSKYKYKDQNCQVYKAVKDRDATCYYL
nr:hypothetical protein [Tanacetum cinerariifolium]